MFQVKDRLFDAKLFANYLPTDNDALRHYLPIQYLLLKILADGSDNKFAFE